MAGHDLGRGPAQLDGHRRQDRQAILTAGQGDRRRPAGGLLVALVARPHRDVDEGAPILDPLARHLAAEHLGVTLVVELADLVVLAFDPAVVTRPVGEEVVQPALAQHAVVVGARVADRLRPRVVPVDALGDVGDAVLVLDVERRDALPVLPAAATGLQPVGHEAVAAGVKDDHVRRGQRTLGLGSHGLADLDVLPPEPGPPLAGLGGVGLVEGGELRVVPARHGDLRVLALVPRLLPLGVDHERAVDADDLRTLVDLDVAQDPDDRAAGELRLLGLHRLQAGEAVEGVTRSHRPVPGPGTAGDEGVDAPVGAALGQGVPVAQQRRVEDRSHDRWRDLPAPPARLTVTRVAEQRIVVAIAVGEVADGLRGRGGQVLLLPARHEAPERRPILREVLLDEDAGGGPLELCLLVGRHAHGSSVPTCGSRVTLPGGKGTFTRPIRRSSLRAAPRHPADRARSPRAARRCAGRGWGRAGAAPTADPGRGRPRRRR